jgi:NADPH-dependent F420 reductase
MNIAIIGTGHMASGLAKQFALAGHRVMLGSRHPAQASLPASTPSSVAVLAIPQALQSAEVVFLAVPFAAVGDVIQAAGPWDGKIVVDITNPLTPDFMELSRGFTTSAAEEIARLIPGARVVKAFNTVFAQVLDQGPDFGSERVSVFYAGDDESANQCIADLIASTGFKPVYAGGLKNARYLEPLAALTIQLAYALGHGTQIAPAFLERPSASS